MPRPDECISPHTRAIHDAGVWQMDFSSHDWIGQFLNVALSQQVQGDEGEEQNGAEVEIKRLVAGIQSTETGQQDSVNQQLQGH